MLEAELLPSEVEDPPIHHPEWVDVAVDDPDGCPRYIARVIRGVSVAPSPMWLRARLHAAGMRPISNVVDVTNYVMHVHGSPLHAFDRAKLADGRIVVRRARKGEKLRTLDGTTREVLPTDLMITDGKEAVALAAIMGGETSEVTDETTDVLLEAANFEPIGILRTSERLGLRTEGSNRWEKGVDPYAAEPAAILASRLHRRRRGRRADGKRRRARRAPGAARGAAATGAHRSRGGSRDRPRRAARHPRPPRIRGLRRVGRARADLAGARRDP